MSIVSGGRHAVRLRRVRELAGPVPPWYPDARPAAGPIRGVRPFIWQAADLVARFGEELMMTGAGLPWSASCPLNSARQLAWGARYRPSPSDAYHTVRLPVDRFLARRTWMCLPGRVGAEPGPVPVVAEVPSTASPLAQQIWRGIHEGAHLDHLSALTALGPAAPSPAEFGTGLLMAESYAMAVEILAAVECVLAEEGHAVWQLGAGLIERATRLPGGSDPAPEFTDLPTLAEVYVRGPLEVLTGGDAARALPEQITARCAPAGAPRARPIRPPPSSGPPPPNCSAPLASGRTPLSRPGWPSCSAAARPFTKPGPNPYRGKSGIGGHCLSSYTRVIHDTDRRKSPA